jgi:SH3-like domain-containing protein
MKSWCPAAIPNFRWEVMLLFLLGSLGWTTPLRAENDPPVPRFVTIKSNEVNARVGPHMRYPVRWTFVRKGEPVEVIAEYEHWRRIRDRYNDEGWVHQSMLSPKRRVVIVANHPVALRRRPTEESTAIAELHPEVRADLDGCENHWCRLGVQGLHGWVPALALWGVAPNDHVPVTGKKISKK